MLFKAKGSEVCSDRAEVHVTDLYHGTWNNASVYMHARTTVHGI